MLFPQISFMNRDFVACLFLLITSCVFLQQFAYEFDKMWYPKSIISDLSGRTNSFEYENEFKNNHLFSSGLLGNDRTESWLFTQYYNTQPYVIPAFCQLLNFPGYRKIIDLIHFCVLLRPTFIVNLCSKSNCKCGMMRMGGYIIIVLFKTASGKPRRHDKIYTPHRPGISWPTIMRKV